jgi:2-amino-4-hydroxy-6-hydroxymethyldihydropteridine diphosphokinase
VINTKPPHHSRVLSSGEHRACLGLGSNVDQALNLRRAIRRLRRVVTVDAISTAWQSPAVGVAGPDYMNAAVLARTSQSRESLMTKLKEIENALGRVHDHEQSALVPIDIDLLVFDLEFAEDDLWSQVYRATPVAELLPDLRCPMTGESVLHAANRLARSFPITPRPEIFAIPRRTGTSRTNTTSPSRTRTP